MKQKKAIESWVDMHFLHNPLPSEAQDFTVFKEETEAKAGNLTNLDLIYQFWKQSGVNIVGEPNSAFSLFNENKGTIITYFLNEKCVENRAPPWAEEISVAFELVQKEGGTFDASDGSVRCAMDGISVEGKNFEEAAMRALLVLTAPKS